MAATQFTINTSQILGGSQVMFRVSATSGITTTTAIAGPITITQAAQLSTDLTSVSFQNVIVNQFLDRTVTLSNPGTGPLSLNIQAPNPPFVVYAPAKVVIQAGQKRAITVRFAPTD